MQIVDAEALLRKANKLHENAQSPEDLQQVEAIYQQALTKNFHHPAILYYLGSLYMDTGRIGAGVELLRSAIAADPNFGEAWNNLGIGLKIEYHNEEAHMVFERAAELLKNDADPYSNIAGIYINIGQPEKAIEYADKALERDPNHGQSLWHKGLATLELQNWQEGWGLYDARLIPGACSGMTVRNYNLPHETPYWDGKSEGLMVIHGEQGLGDEILFMTCLPDILKMNPDVIIECTPKLEGVFKQAFPELRIVGTNAADGSEWPEEWHVSPKDVIWKLAMGSMPGYCRRSEDDFPGTPYLTADSNLRRKWRNRLGRLGKRPKIGIAWQGGSPKTRVDLRSLQLEQFLPILGLECDFISLQYHDIAVAELTEFEEKHGIWIHHWPEVAGPNMIDDKAACMAELDMIVSVCQTSIHLAGGLGKECKVLVPAGPAWRYGVTGNMPWYDSVNLYRQEDDDWQPVVQQIADELKERFGC